MPELTTPEGDKLDLDMSASAGTDPQQTEREFARAMATDTPGEVQSPPRRDAAPGAEETPARRRRGGRPAGSRNKPKDDERARVAKAPQRADINYPEAAEGVTTMAWAALAAIPYTTPYAAVVDANQTALIAALANAGQQNDRIGSLLAQAAGGGGGIWAVQLAAVGVNMAMQCLEIMRDGETRLAATVATQAKFRKFLVAQGVQLADEAVDSEPRAA